MTNPRMRMAAVAGSLALSLSFAAAPAVLAQEGPEATIQGFMDAVVAKDFEALPSYFCEAQAAQAANFDMAALAEEMPPGLDVQSLLDAFIFDVTLDSIDVLSQTDTEAVTHVMGSMAMDIDVEVLTPFIEAIIEMSGMEADEDTIAMFTDMMLSEFEAESIEIDDDVTLVAGEEMPWLICSDLGFGDDDMDDDMIDDGMSDDMDDDMAEEDDGE